MSPSNEVFNETIVKLSRAKPKRYDIILYQGSSYRLTVWVRYIDGTFKLTGWTGAGQIRKTRRSSVIIAEFDCTIANELTGQLEVVLSSTDTALVEAGETLTDSRSKYVYDIEITKGTLTYRILEGYIYMSPEVTR
jgi:hypothetical protein